MSKLIELSIFTDTSFLTGFCEKHSEKVQIILQTIYAEENFSSKHAQNLGFLRSKDLAQEHNTYLRNSSLIQKHIMPAKTIPHIRENFGVANWLKCF